MCLEDNMPDDITPGSTLSPDAARSACLRRTLELGHLLRLFDQDWARSQRRFYSSDGVIFLGAGASPVPSIEA